MLGFKFQVCLIVYILGFSVGFGPLPWAINAEMFPKEAQELMTPFATAFNWSLSFIVTKFSSDLENQIHTWGLYYLFGGVCLLGTLFVLFVVPETKGKTPDDMKMYFMGISKKGHT